MICWTVQKPLQILLGDNIWSNYSDRKHEFFTPNGGLGRDLFFLFQGIFQVGEIL